MTSRIPIVDYLVLDDPPHLQANACVVCSANYFDRRNACARCGGTDFGKKRLATTGVVSAFTVVHRAAKSIPTPYISSIVALDGGGAVKANLVGVEAEDITRNLRVSLVTSVVGVDDDGVEAVSFAFEPMEDQ